MMTVIVQVVLIFMMIILQCFSINVLRKVKENICTSRTELRTAAPR